MFLNSNFLKENFNKFNKFQIIIIKISNKKLINFTSKHAGVLKNKKILPKLKNSFKAKIFNKITMANLESYSNLTRLQEDLIKKGFSFGQLFALSIYAKSPNNVNFKSSYKQLLNTDHQPTNQSSSYLNYKTSELSIKQEFQTSKSR